jgi:hypothetical protein
MWKNKDTRYTVFVDKRVECKPDIVADNRYLPIRPRSVDIVMYDPPHWVRTRKDSERFIHITYGDYLLTRKPRKDGRMYPSLIAKYSYWATKTAYINNVYLTEKSFSFVLKPNGFVLIKLTQMPSKASLGLPLFKDVYRDWCITHSSMKPSRSYRGNSLVYFLSACRAPTPRDAAQNKLLET